LGAYACWLQTMGCKTKPEPLMLKAKVKETIFLTIKLLK